MKRLFLILLVMVLFAAFGATVLADNEESLNDPYDSSKEQEYYNKMLDSYLKVAPECNDMEEVLRLIPEFDIFVNDHYFFVFLSDNRENDKNGTDGEYINILISYIEHGFEISDFEQLRYNPVYQSITLTTISGNTISGLILTGADDSVNYPNCSTVYPNAHKISNGTYAYNCHSYAWYYRGTYNSADKMWINDPSTYATSTHCYSLIDSGVQYSSISSVDIHVGDIITYQALPNDQMNLQYLNVHSAIVTSVSNSTITVRSKWGFYPVYEHALNECPYYSGKLDNGTTYYRSFNIYRPLHSITTSLVANQKYVAKNSTKHYLTCSYCSRYLKTTTQNHTFVTVGSVKRCTKCGYRETLVSNP